ncbi:multidrug resistance-associated protein 5 [Tanacetum coccineum]
MIPGTDLHCFDVHNDSYFSHLPLAYVDGVILEMAVRWMPYEEFAVYLEEKSLSYMFDVEETFGRLNLYLDHLDMNLSEYLSQAITYDMDACVSKKIGPPKKRDDATDGVDATDKGKEKVSQDATEVVETRRSTVEIDSETEYDSDDDSDYQLDNSVDYLSPDKEELIKLRNRIKANREAKAKAKDNPVLEMNETNNENSMPADNVRDETFEEHDIYMNELLKSLKTADKDRIIEDPFISIGEKYVSGAQFKECLTYYALGNGFSLWYERSGEYRVVAKYGQRKPRFSNPEKGKQRKQTRNFNFGSLVNYKWIAKIFGDNIKANPDIKLCDIADLVMKKYKCKATPNQCTNVKKYALTEYKKTIGEHYAMLRSYGKAILDSNPESTVKLGVIVNPDDKTYFDRFYICFAGLADGWKAGCRKIIALYEQDLGYSSGNRLTLMSDQHKGLKDDVKDVLPNTEHRKCARHIYENFRKQYPGLEYRQMFWAELKPHPVPESYVPAWFETDMYYVAYHNFVKPFPGMNFWPDQSMSRCGVSVSRGDASVYRGGASVSRGGAGGSKGGAGGSRGGADEPEQTQDEPQQTQHEPVQAQDEDQVEQTQEQAEIDLTPCGERKPKIKLRTSCNPQEHPTSNLRTQVQESSKELENRK